MDGATRVSVKEYAEQHEISVQSVYKKISKGTLKTAREKINGKEVLFILLEDPQPEDLNHVKPDFKPIQPDIKPIKPALNQEEVELNRTLNPDSTTLNQPEVEKVEMVENALNHDSTGKAAEQEQNMIAFLQEQIRALNGQLEAKDKQIETIQKLLDQEQQLHARTNLLLAEYQRKEAEQAEQPPAEEEPAEDPQPQPEPETTEPKPKRSWFYRFFFGED